VLQLKMAANLWISFDTTPLIGNLRQSEYLSLDDATANAATAQTINSKGCLYFHLFIHLVWIFNNDKPSTP